MLRMTTTAGMVQKAAVGRSKSGRWPFKKSAFGGKKTIACVIPFI